MNTDIHTGRINVLKLMDLASALFITHELDKLLDEDIIVEARELKGVEGVGRNFLAWNLDDETGTD